MLFLIDGHIKKVVFFRDFNVELRKFLNLILIPHGGRDNVIWVCIYDLLHTLRFD